MTDHKECKYYEVCDYRNDVGSCPDRCVQYNHKNVVFVTRWNECIFSKLPSPAVQRYGVPGTRVCGKGNSPCNHRLVLGTDYCPYGRRAGDG